MSVPARLVSLLGPDRVFTESQILADHARDLSTAPHIHERRGSEPSRPLCVIRPTSSIEISEVLRWANETRTPVVPFGGGSGVVEGIAPKGAVVLDLGGLDEIGELDEKSRVVTAQAGVTGPSLHNFLLDKGLTTGHEPQSIDISTVGGWVATRACGQLSARYGGIEDLIVSLDAVLPNGDVVSSAGSPRRATGPDVGSLLIGSEGALGVVTAATLRVFELPVESAGCCISFDHMADGVAACRMLAQSDLGPSLVRLYDREDTSIFLRNHPEPVPGPLLLVAFEGAGASSRRDIAVDRAGGAAADPSLVDYWRSHRNEVVSEYRSLLLGEGVLGPHPAVDTMEVSGRWSVLRNLYHSLKEALEDKADIVGCHLSHVYPDGACLYFTMASICDDDDVALAVHATWWEVGMNACLEAGGSISHHHGIGRLKARWLPQELGGWWEALRAVKGALDPNNIMNPGVLGL